MKKQKIERQFNLAPQDDQLIPRKLREMMQDTPSMRMKPKNTSKPSTKQSATYFANKTNSLSEKQKDKRSAFFKQKKQKQKKKVIEIDGYATEIIKFGDIVHAPPQLTRLK